jgi:hypothetical protein
MEIYHDLDLFGNDTASGEAIIHYDHEAVDSALTTWITSKMGDILKRPNDAGILDRALFKNMTDDKIDQLIFLLRTGITNDFSPAIELKKLYIQRDYIRQILIINLEYSEPITGKTQSLKVYTKDLTTKSSFTFEEIEFSGLNLRNWVLIKKPEMKSKLLKFNSEKLSWQWGKYLLINLEATDEYFEELLSIINLS